MTSRMRGSIWKKRCRRRSGTARSKRRGRYAVRGVQGRCGRSRRMAGCQLWPRATPPASVSVKIAIPMDRQRPSLAGCWGRLWSRRTAARSLFAEHGQVARTFVRRLDSDDLKRLEGTTGAVYPFWSPDSQTIGFFADGKSGRWQQPAARQSTLLGAEPARRGVVEAGHDHSRNNFRGHSRCDSQTGEPVEITNLDTSLGENSHRYP